MLQKRKCNKKMSNILTTKYCGIYKKKKKKKNCFISKLIFNFSAKKINHVTLLHISVWLFPSWVNTGHTTVITLDGEKGVVNVFYIPGNMVFHVPFSSKTRDLMTWPRHVAIGTSNVTFWLIFSDFSYICVFFFFYQKKKVTH